MSLELAKKLLEELEKNWDNKNLCINIIISYFIKIRIEMINYFMNKK